MTDNIWDAEPTQEEEGFNWDTDEGTDPEPKGIFDDSSTDLSTALNDAPKTENLDDVAKKLDEPKPVAKKYKLTIDGNDEEVDEDVLIKRAQKAAAADKRFQEAAELRKQSEQLLSMLKNDPFSVLEQLGLDPAELSTRHLEREIEKLKMSPEERELKQLRDWKMQQEQLHQQEQQALKEQQEQQEMQRLADQYTKDIISSMETVNLPRHEGSVKAMVDLMSQAVKNGLDVSWTDVAKEVKNRYYTDYKTLFDGMSDDEFESVIGQDRVKRIVKRSAQKVYQQPLPKEQPKQSVSKRSSVWDD